MVAGPDSISPLVRKFEVHTTMTENLQPNPKNVSQSKIFVLQDASQEEHIKSKIQMFLFRPIIAVLCFPD